MIATVIAAAASKEKAGFAPFETWHFPSQIFWLIVLFGTLYFVLSRFILPQIGSTMERRESTIANELDEASRLNDKALESQQATDQAIAKAHAKARETAAKARSKIDADISEATAKADTEIEQKLAAAETRLGALRQEAMAKVQSRASDAAQAILVKFGAKVTKAKVTSSVKAVLKG